MKYAAVVGFALAAAGAWIIAISLAEGMEPLARLAIIVLGLLFLSIAIGMLKQR